METIRHLWNLTSLFANTNVSEANNLRTHYIQCCRELGNNVELPINIFGPVAMCPLCDTLWNKVNTTVRISKSRQPSRLIRKFIHHNRNNKDECNKSIYKTKLREKSIKNQLMNKLVITCSICNKPTTIPLTKSKKEKFKLKNNHIIGSYNNGLTEINSKRKKKRKAKDKTAGLIMNKYAERQTPAKMESPSPAVIKSNSNKNGIPSMKANRINITKLKGIIETTITSSNKSNLHSFLTQLK